MSSPVQNEIQEAAVALKENRVNDSLLLLQSAFSKAPEDFSTNHLLGVALGKAGRGPESSARLLKATQINPASAAAQTHLGMAYAAADKAELARAAFQTALRIDANFAPAQNALSSLPAPTPVVPKPVVQATAPPPVTPATTKSAAAKSDAKAAKAKDKAVRPAKPKAEIDYVEWSLRIMGFIFVVGGLYLRFGLRVEGIRIYSLPGMICIVLGIAMLKAGFPSEDDWKDDFR